MNPLPSYILLSAAVLIHSSLATNNTLCYDYFLRKDGCVFAAADDRNRCKPNSPPNGSSKFALSNTNSNQKRALGHKFDRRYDTTQGVFPVGGGEGICGPYDTNRDHGACLWSGSSNSGANQSTAGWLNGAKTSNCGKRLYIQRKGQPNTVVYVPIIDGCGFNTFDVTIGCFQIALTNKTFNALSPTQAETDAQAIWDISWDFDNLYGNSTNQAPV